MIHLSNSTVKDNNHVLKFKLYGQAYFDSNGVQRRNKTNMRYYEIVEVSIIQDEHVTYCKFETDVRTNTNTAIINVKKQKLKLGRAKIVVKYRQKGSKGKPKQTSGYINILCDINNRSKKGDVR